MAVIKETRQVKDFSEVELQGYGDILLEQNEGPEALVIEADEAILKRLKSEVIGRRLVLAYDVPWWDWLYWVNWMFFPDKKIRFYLTMKNVNEIGIKGAGSLTSQQIHTDRGRIWVSGSGNIRIQALKTGSLSLETNGSGNIQIEGLQAESIDTRFGGSGDATLSGVARRHEIHISGAGRMRAADLQTEATRVTISGSGSVRVNAQESLDVSISGSGDVRYSGDPRVSQRITGAGRVARL